MVSISTLQMTQNKPRNSERLFRIREYLPYEVRKRVTEDKIEEFFDSLSRRQQLALMLYYGLGGAKSHTYKQVAEIMEGTPMAIEQLIRRTKRRLQKLCK